MGFIDTETSWLVDDVPLNSWARNVSELESKYGAPGVRGYDSLVSYRNGTMWMPKIPDFREISIGMWISHLDAAGNVTDLGKQRQFDKNMKELQRLLYTYGRRQVKLTKRWYDETTGAVVSASTYAEVKEGLHPTMEESGYDAKMVVTFHLTDPYFYGEGTSASLVKGVPKTIQVLGDVPTIRISVEFDGILSNGKITNSTTNPVHWVQVGSAIADGDSITLDTEDFTATRTSDGANLISAITRSGGREWMEFFPGSNVLTLTSSSGSGTATVSWSPVYL